MKTKVERKGRLLVVVAKAPRGSCNVLDNIVYLT